jgi:hypothetical protein
MFPTTPDVYAGGCSSCGISLKGVSAASIFVSKLSSDGTKLVWSTYIPPNFYISPGLSISAITLDKSGNALIVGTANQFLPTTLGAIQPSLPKGGVTETGDYIAELDVNAQHLNFATYFGSGSVGGVAVTPGEVWIAGSSSASSLPGAPLSAHHRQPVLWPLSLPMVQPSIHSNCSPLVREMISAARSIAVLGSPDWLAVNGSPGSPLRVIADAADGLVSGTYVAGEGELLSLYGKGVGPSTPVATQDWNGGVGG